MTVDRNNSSALWLGHALWGYCLVAVCNKKPITSLYFFSFFLILQTSLIGVEDMRSLNMLTLSYMSCLLRQRPASHFPWLQRWPRRNVVLLLLSTLQTLGQWCQVTKLSHLFSRQWRTKIAEGVRHFRNKSTDRLVHCSAFYHSVCYEK